MDRSLWKRFQDMPLVAKLAASLILPSLLSVVVVSAVLSSLYSARAREDLSRINTLHLGGIKSQAEAALSSSLKLAYLLKNDQNLLDALGPSPEAVLAYSRATTQINQFLLSTPYVDSIILGHQNRIIYSLYQRDSYREPKDRMLAVLRSSPTSPKVRLVLRSNGELGRVLTFVVNESNRTEYIDSAAAVNLNLEALQNDLFGDTPGSGDRSYLLLDAAGAILADSHWLAGVGPTLGSRDTLRLIEAAEPTGWFRTTEGTRNLIVSYVRSSSQGFTVAAVMDYGAYMSGIDGLGGLTLGFCAAVVVVLLAGALFIGNRLYLPLDGIFRRIQRLRHAPEPPGTVHDLAYATQVLSWTAERLDAEETLGPELLAGDQEALRKASLTLEPGDCLFVSVGRIDGQENGSPLVPMTALARETLRPRWPCFAFPQHDRDVVVVCRVPAGVPLRAASLEGPLRSWITSVDRTLGVSMSVGVGDLVTESHDLRESYLGALRRVRCRVFVGGQSLILADGAPPPGTSTPSTAPCLADLEHAATSGDRTKALGAIERLLVLTRPLGTDARIERVVDAAETLCGVGARLGRQSLAHRGELLRATEDCWGTERVQSWLIQLFDRVQRSLDEVRNVRTPDLVVRAFGYLEQHYRDPLLSAAVVANALSITPQYFSRIFNEHTGTSFPDHLKQLRLDKARGLIVDRPSTSLDEVCEATGFRNKTYFTTAFKQRFGVTPGKLRLACRRSALEDSSVHVSSEASRPRPIPGP